ncbi:MAG: single-stranded-DNA-specific exonuclease RecJ [Planctomycetota bacterium]|nr:MAG: single-stranded-DNA-specific exonuclease RecJ [Planctomycetota bacterium]
MRTSAWTLNRPKRTAALRQLNKVRPTSPKKLWVIQPPHPHAPNLARALKVSPLLAQVLINRGITDTHAGAIFLRPKLTELISPELMPGVKTAVSRINQAIKKNEKITIYGDYDVDGITGVAILWQLITLLGGNVDYYIPHRIDEGYGLNADAIHTITKTSSKLLITVDCGITAFNSAQLAEQLGLDLIITDHHLPEPELPKAAAVVHPALDTAYANQDSSGSMVAFKLAWAIANEFNKGRKLQPNLREFMLNATSLAAMGTIADLVDLRGENRILTSYGLKSLSQSNLVGILALIDSAGLTGQGLDSFSIGFHLAPMLNAAGRMGHARLAVELLTTENSTHSNQIAEYLKQQNELRRKYEQKIFKQACEMIAEQGLDHQKQKSIVLASQNWHTGVIGIVASRIAEIYHRPAIMFNASKDANAQGSARSIKGFCLLTAIKACSEHLISFGGHEMAAGITIKNKKIKKFAADFETYAKHNLAESDCIAKLYIDAAAKLIQFKKETVTELQMLGPFGRGNPRPIFATKGVRLAAPPRTCGIKNDHLQLAITDNTNAVRCIGFGMANLEKKLLEQEFFNVAYQPQLNTYNGYTNVEFVLAGIQFE